MGQYFAIYNLDKKERLTAIASGVKLWEISSDQYTMMSLSVLLANSNGRGGGDLNVEIDYDKTYKPTPTWKQQAALAKVKAISGRWAGDRIVFQGDYAEDGDPAFTPEAELEEFKDITQKCIDALRASECGIDEDGGFKITKSFGRLR